MPNWRAVRTNRWKYIQYPGFETFDELYDLENDRREVHNLAGNPEFREPLQTMRSELMNLLRQTGTSIAPHDVRVTP
jgi:arylsulfatase A-like enzyme